MESLYPPSHTTPIFPRFQALRLALHLGCFNVNRRIPIQNFKRATA
jgi:hypothetical protein